MSPISGTWNVWMCKRFLSLHGIANPVFSRRFPRLISPPPDASHKLAVENINIHLIISLGALLEHPIYSAS